MADVDEPINDREKVLYLNVFACRLFFKFKLILITHLKMNLLPRSDCGIIFIIVYKQGFFEFFFFTHIITFPFPISSALTSLFLKKKKLNF